jgi:hypothetical protein
MNRVLIIALVVMSGLFVWSFLNLLDAGISIDHARMETKYQRERVNLLQSLLRHATEGRGHSDIRQFLVGDLPGENVVEVQEDRIDVGGWSSLSETER